MCSISWAPSVIGALAGDAVEALGVPILGALPRDATIALPERHLGLVQAGETAQLERLLEALADRIEAHVDVDAIVASAGAPLSPPPSGEGLKLVGVAATLPPPARRIAVARDEAFSFFYPHLAATWRDAGAQLCFFSPLADEAPPDDADFCWLPGGYPELHAGRLARAERFMSGLRRFAQTRPVHGECGGYMVLGRALVSADGVTHPMAGLLDLETSFARRKLNLGYRRATLAADNNLGPAGTILRGHEFHYATIAREEGRPFATVCDAYSDVERPAGLCSERVSGSFFHMIA